MKVLITGIAGFMGSRFAQWLLENKPGVEILGVDNLLCGYIENVHPDCRFANCTIGTGRLPYCGLDFRGVDYVFHFAAYAAEGFSPFIRRKNYMHNLLPTAEVINFCVERKVKRLVYTSSMAVYGVNHPPFHEDMPRNPIDPYGIAKTASEMDIEVAGKQHGMDWCIIRPHNLYGPGQSLWQKYRNVLGLWIGQILQGLPVTIFGDGEQIRAFSFLEDCLPCLWEAAVRPEASREIINLGGKSPTTISEAQKLLSSIREVSHLSPQVVYLEPRHEVKYAWCTTQKSIDLLGYEERTGLFHGLVEFWEWARSVWSIYPERREKVHPSPEIEEGLYPYWRGDNQMVDAIPHPRVYAT